MDGNWSSSELVPNDNLSIKYDQYSGKEWVDNKTKLEEQLPKILAHFELRSIQDQRYREESRLWEEKRKIQEEIERKDKAQRDWELSKQNILISNAKEWRKAKDLRDFIKKIEQSNDNSTKTQEWLKWAKQVASDIDPLSGGISSFISEFDMPENLIN
jgi:hypothetical protein